MITSRKIDTVFIHCSASDNPAHDNVDTIRRWHVEGNGWSDVGYHFVITQDGIVRVARPLRRVPAAQKGHNRGSVAICLTGLSEFSSDQFDALRNLCNRLETLHGETMPLRFRGHCEVSRKTCPVFDYQVALTLDPQGYALEGRLVGSQHWEAS